ncbi:MAG: ribosome small subunit-dependent GTPase A [Paenibacillaceae bacterium]|nr:ribosome small subunit-dependent GTPase A [Paenibacillaceae bacterium]
MDWKEWGWNEARQEQWDAEPRNGVFAGRVVLEHKHLYRVVGEHGEWLAEVAGKLRHAALGRADYPAVGDWVTLRAMDGAPAAGSAGKRPDSELPRAIIDAVLPRSSVFSRRAAGSRPEEQIVAANVDTVFLVNALNNDFNVRRMERYLTLAWDSGAMPVLVLTKTDLCGDVEERLAQTEAVAMGVPTFAISALTREGLEPLADYLVPGQTVALLGSSGAGKSTLINTLIGRDIQAVREVREGDDRGKHTTTHRELFMLPGGALVIDTPGMRELQLWGDEGGDGLDAAFEDIAAYAASCRFGDCSHGKEPGCAIREALRTGELAQERYDSYLKLQRELQYIARKEDIRLQLQEKERWKKIHTAQKEHYKRF